ncbi:unnamed protein product [Brassica oleracea var. botrytis]
MMSPGPQRERHKQAKEGELQNHRRKIPTNLVSSEFRRNFVGNGRRNSDDFIFLDLVGNLSVIRHKGPTTLVKIWSCVCVNPSTYNSCIVLSLICLRGSWSFRTKFILGFSVFLGLSIPQYFNEYTAIKGYGPVHTGARWFNDMVNVPFCSEPFVAGVVAFFLDNSLHKKDSSIRKDRGKHWWDKFRSFKGDTRSEEFYSLPFNLNKYFPCALCFYIVKVLEFVAKKESLQLLHGFTALQVLLGNIREALQVICLYNCPTDELFCPGDKDTEAHELFGSYVSIITCSFKSQLIPFYRSSSRRRVNGEPLHRNIIITEKDDCYSFNKTLLQTLFIRHSIMIIETKADL